MSGELQTDLGQTGKTLYFLIRNANGLIWNGSTFTSYVSANYSQYPVSATEQGSSGFYVGNFPGASGGFYSSIAKIQAGANPAETDVSVGWGNLQWDGAAIVALAPAQTTFQNNLATTFLKFNSSAIAGEPIHSPINALRKLNNKLDTLALSGFLTVYKEDGATVAYTQALTSQSGAAPTVSVGDA